MSIMVKMLVVMLLLSACTVVRNPTPLDYPGVQAVAVPTDDYRLQVGDQLDVKFFYHPELNESVTVRPDGRISLQLVQEIRVLGMTPLQLTEKLTKAYSAELDKPSITVIVKTFNTHRVFVDGEVNKAGLVPLIGPMTVLQSISQGGGLKDTARTNEVIVIRRVAENKIASLVVNLDYAVDGTDMRQDILLQPNDIVFVPKSPIANVDVWVDQYIRRLIPIPFGVGYGL
ncbi:polysaccharide biosynthesis/export family protein [Geomobilimonas luticola]|uniref:Polysaccharide export protein n=1 Tax=Geomobilimonas luticola TaxID=1114878 RepID=A0ABS5SC08_9BACT|nr:polysaccharide biosynthesis/export family protein [Geomobilimonas luticola]MBT0652913.1 polysaccharide export protein [Geomobilimonas luticola]